MEIEKIFVVCKDGMFVNAKNRTTVDVEEDTVVFANETIARAFIECELDEGYYVCEIDKSSMYYEIAYKILMREKEEFLKMPEASIRKGIQITSLMGDVAENLELNKTKKYYFLYYDKVLHIQLTLDNESETDDEENILAVIQKTNKNT